MEAFAWTGVNYEPWGNQLLQFDLVNDRLKPSIGEEDEVGVALINEVRQFGGLVSAGLGVQVEDLETLRQLLGMKLADNPGQVGGVRASHGAPFLSTKQLSLRTRPGWNQQALTAW